MPQRTLQRVSASNRANLLICHCAGFGLLSDVGRNTCTNSLRNKLSGKVRAAGSEVASLQNHKRAVLQEAAPRQQGDLCEFYAALSGHSKPIQATHSHAELTMENQIPKKVTVMKTSLLCIYLTSVPLDDVSVCVCGR